MRCYLFRHGHIAAVTILKVESDEALIAEARAFFDARERDFEGFEIWDGARFVYRYPQQPPAYRSVPMGRPSYRLYLLGDDDIIQGYFDFPEESDEAAYEIAALAFDACSDRAMNFELWHNSQRINPLAMPLRAQGQAQANRQAQFVALGERMRDSRWAIASSKRLLGRLNDMKPRVAADNEPVP